MVIFENQSVSIEYYQDCVSINPPIRFGKPCVTGKRIAVQDVLIWLASGMIFEEILEDFPELTIEQVRAASSFGKPVPARGDLENYKDGSIFGKITLSNMIKEQFLNFHIGNKTLNSHLDAVHAKGPKSDLYTGEIVKGVVNKTNASGIIATISRTEMDINRSRDQNNAPAIDEYREAINEIIKSKKILNSNNLLTKNYLHLAIHGMKNRSNTDFEIGTRNGDSCSEDINN